MKRECQNICTHADMIVDGEVEVCVPVWQVSCGVHVRP